MKKNYLTILLLSLMFISLKQNVIAQCAGADSVIYKFDDPSGTGGFSGYLCTGQDSVGTTGASGFYDGDGYEIKLVAGSEVTFSIDNCSGNNVSLTVNDSANNIISGAYSAPACPNSLDFTATYSGKYKIIMNKNGVCNGGGTSLIGQAYVKIKSGSNVPDCPVANLVNDTICGAIPLYRDSVFEVGNTADAFPTDPMDSYITSIGYTCSLPNNTLWYSFTSPTNVSLNLWITSDLGSNFHSKVAVFIAQDSVNPCSGGLTLLGCEEGANDGAGINTISIPLLGIGAGDTWYFMIDGFSGSTGGFSISIRTSPFTDIAKPVLDENNISVFPNPALNTLNIRSINLNNATVSLFNPLGQKVSSQKFIAFSHAEIDVSSQISGLYVLEISSDNGVIRKKILINK